MGVQQNKTAAFVEVATTLIKMESRAASKYRTGVVWLLKEGMTEKKPTALVYYRREKSAEIEVRAIL